MRLTPLDIRKQEFKKAMRGLDADEVYAFLSTIADEYEAVLNDNKALRERVLELDDKVHEYRNMEKTLRDTLLTAERVTVEAKDNARREADLIVKEAELEAEDGVRRIKTNAARMRQEIQSLRQQRDAYLARMRMMVESHLKFLKTAEEDFVDEDRQIETHKGEVEDTGGRKKTKRGAAKQTAHVAEPPPVTTPVETPHPSAPPATPTATPGTATPGPDTPEPPQEPVADGPVAEQTDTPGNTAVMTDDPSSRLNTILERLVGRRGKPAPGEAPRPEFAEIPDTATQADADVTHTTQQTSPESAQAGAESQAHRTPVAADGDALEPNPVAAQPGQWSLEKLKQDILSRSQKKDEKN